MTEQQNQAEIALEDAAHPLGRALRLYHRKQNNLADAKVWDLQLTDWRQLRENELLNKAKALGDAVTPFATGEVEGGTRFGITPPKVAAFNTLVNAYDAIIGAPRASRNTRKAKTQELPVHFRLVDGLLEDMDDLIISLRGQSAAHDLFVAAYFNARRIGGESHDHTETQTPTP